MSHWFAAKVEAEANIHGRVLLRHLRSGRGQGDAAFCAARKLRLAGRHTAGSVSIWGLNELKQIQK
jgi:hypothetical protein